MESGRLKTKAWRLTFDVENWPKDVIVGRDPQLNRAVKEAMRMLKERPVERAPKEPPLPVWGKRP